MAGCLRRQNASAQAVFAIGGLLHAIRGCMVF
jgi:hypothetical protein